MSLNKKRSQKTHVIIYVRTHLFYGLCLFVMFQLRIVPVELLSCKIVAKVTHPQKDIISVENSRYCFFHTLLAIFVKLHTMYNSNKYVALLTPQMGLLSLEKKLVKTLHKILCIK